MKISRNRNVLLAMMLTMVASLTIGMASCMTGCTAAQLGQATADIGGKPLTGTTINVGTSTQPVYVTVPPTTQAAGANLVSQGASEGATIAAATGTPWGAIAASVLGIVAAIATVFATSQTSKLSTAQNVIAAAAPGVAKIVGQITDNKSLQTDITSIAEVPTAVMDLLATVPTTHASVATSVAAAASTASPVVIEAPIKTV